MNIENLASILEMDFNEIEKLCHLYNGDLPNNVIKSLIQKGSFSNFNRYNCNESSITKRFKLIRDLLREDVNICQPEKLSAFAIVLSRFYQIIQRIEMVKRLRKAEEKKKELN